jgi:hypothetical protein
MPNFGVIGCVGPAAGHGTHTHTYTLSSLYYRYLYFTKNNEIRTGNSAIRPILSIILILTCLEYSLLFFARKGLQANKNTQHQLKLFYALRDKNLFEISKYTQMNWEY